ncbi:MAG: tetratricopeptide repeat protein, partial [Firmicutes bacterium]|nr:tetratricopeptide repeat protein [Bacillota bacterium]
IEMGEISWEKGYEDDSWTIDMTEAYFETGQLDKAQQIIDLVNEGKKRLSLKGQLKLKEIKARLLFENDKTAEAYEIMNELCGRPESSVHQKYILAGMYMKTGNIKGAVKLLSVIKLYSDNLSYIYDLGRCMQEEQDYDYAHYLFIQVYMADPEFRDVAFMVGQTAVDAGLQKQMPDILKEIDTHITEYQKRYLQGEYKEMQSRFKDAQLIYAELIKDYVDGLYPEELLYDTYVRYLLMKEESDVRITKHIEEVKNILRRFTDAEAIWNYFGEFHCRIDSPDIETERCFKNVLRLNKYNKTAKMNLMAIYSQQEKWDITWDICTDLIVNTDWNDAYYYRALHGIELGRYEQSRADIECYESKGGDSNNCLIVRQHLAMKQGDYEEAIKQIETRLKNRKVSEVPCYDFYAICLCKLGRWQEAEELMDMVCETSRRPSFHGILYRIQKYNGRFSEARETLKRYKKLCDVGILDEEYPLLNLQLMLESGKGLLAQPMAEAIDSRDGERFVAMLEMFYGSTGKAARLFQKLVKNEPEEVNNYIWSAFTLYIKGKTQEAQQYAQAGLNAYEKNFGKIEITASPYRVCQYGLLKIFAGDSAEAKKLFELAEKMPTCTTSVCTGCYKAHCGLGIMYALNGYKDKADEEFNKSLEIRPYNTVCKKIKDKLLK